MAVVMGWSSFPSLPLGPQAPGPISWTHQRLRSHPPLLVFSLSSTKGCEENHFGIIPAELETFILVLRGDFVIHETPVK